MANIFGGMGNDNINLYGQTGSNTVDGGDGDDEISGGIGDDTLIGGAGNDFLFGDEGNNILYGGPGDDILKVVAQLEAISSMAATATIPWKAEQVMTD